MLTREERRQIDRYGISTYHDYWVMSLYAGEPFLQHGVLSYFDGRVVTLSGTPLRGMPVIGADLVCRLAQSWVTERRAESILFVGPQEPNFNCLSEFKFRKTAESLDGEISAELLIDCSDKRDRIINRRTFRRAQSMEFETTVRTGGIVEVGHLELIELFYRVRSTNGYLAEVAFVLPTLLRSKRVYLIEARKGSKLCGFVMLHKAFDGVAIGLFLFHDHASRGVCDFLYGRMLDLANRLGATSVNVGSSPTKGIYDFKRKWGGIQAVPAYRLAEWTRGSLARRYHKSYGPRLIKL